MTTVRQHLGGSTFALTRLEQGTTIIALHAHILSAGIWQKQGHAYAHQATVVISAFTRTTSTLVITQVTINTVRTSKSTALIKP